MPALAVVFQPICSCTNALTRAQAATQSLRAHGLVGLYSGFGSSLLGEMIGTGLGFCAYELGNQWWERTHGAKPTAAQKGAIGAASAFVVMTATMPLELIQRRMQVLVCLVSGPAPDACLACCLRA